MQRARRVGWMCALLALSTWLTSTVSVAASVEPNRISLPQGPASVEGLGRSFVPSLATGTAAYGIDIAVPPSAGNFAPALVIEYDSGGGVSELGQGFRLSGVPAVRRRTEEGLPRFDETDLFELVGLGVPSELLPMKDGTYRSRFESGAFVRVLRATEGDGWEARTKSGITFRFGGPECVEAEGEHVATYLLREQVDTHGHVIRYAWDVADGRALLRNITWNDVSPEATQVVSFEYESRPDVHELFSSGIRQVLSQRVAAIKVTRGGELVRRYELTYEKGSQSRLEHVRMFGTDGKTALPTLSFEYTKASFATVEQVVTMQSPPGRSLSDKNATLADLNGDGLPDILVAEAGRFRSYVNQDGLSWLKGVDWSSADAPSVALSTQGVQLADFDGDGALDLAIKSGTASLRYLPGQDEKHWRPSVAVATVPNVTFEDANVRLADFDGDRRVDVAVTTPAGLAIGYNQGGTDFTQPATVGKVDLDQELLFADGHTQLCDVNGDRLQDFCYLRPGSLKYWLGRGRGSFEPPRTAGGVPAFEPADPWRLVDLNGDGWVDLVHVGVNQLEFALAVAAGEFEKPRRLEGTPTKSPSTTTIEFADMNGSGTTDIVWVDTTGTEGAAWKYLELFPSGRAGLLSRIENGLGKLTSISYKPAALDAAEARAAGHPWTTRMNIGMPVVSRIEVDTSLGDPVLTTEFSYGDGTWDPAMRTFAGFAAGTQRELGDAWTPTLVTLSTFDTGVLHRVLRGAPLSVETQTEEGATFSASFTAYTPRILGKSSDGVAIEYAFKSSERVTQFELGDSSSARTMLTEWDQDEFGNVTEERRFGEIMGDDVTVGSDESITTRTFANNTDDWLLGYLASEETTELDGKLVALKRYYYDGKPFMGLPLGQVARGDLTRVEAWAGPEEDTFQKVSATRYDQHGNPLEVHDGRGGVRTYEWDLESASRVIGETIATGKRTLSAGADYDPKLGTLTSFTDFNGAVTTYGYDPLGRLTRVVRPGDTDALPTTSYEYTIEAPLSRVRTVRRITSGRKQTERYDSLVDGLGRQRGTVAWEDDGRVVLGEVSLYDARGQARRSLYPRYVKAEQISLRDLLSDAEGLSTWHDALGRGIATRTELGFETRTEYAPLKTRHWDAAQNDPATPYEHTPVVESFDGLGRMTSISWRINSKTIARNFVYDAAGQTVLRRDPEGHETTFGYDGRGRLTSVEEPDAGLNTFVLDAEGDVLERHHPDHKITKYTYDLLGRPLTEDWDGDGKPEVVKEYDLDDSTIGLLSTVTEPSGSTRFSYDSRERVTATTRVIGSQTYVIGARFDAQDRLIGHGYPDGSWVGIQRNARGLPRALGENAVTFEYEADGKEKQRTYSSGPVEVFGFDSDRRLEERTLKDANGSAVQHLKWTYDPAGNITGREDLRKSIAKQQDLSATYTLDNLYRLVGVTAPWGSSTWDYSPNGRLLKKTSSVPSERLESLGYGKDAGPNALTSIGKRRLTYDARGRLRNDGERTYEFNGIDRLEHVSVANGASVESVFDAQGDRRIRIETGADGKKTETHFIDDWSEVQDGKLIRYLVHQGERVVRLGDGTRENAALGSTNGKLTTNFRDANGRRAFTSVALAVITQPFALLAVVLLVALGSYFGIWAALRRFQLRAALPLGVVLILAACGSDGSPTITPIGSGSAGDVAAEPIAGLTEHDRILVHDQAGSLLASHAANGTPLEAADVHAYGTPRFDTGAVEGRRFAGAPRDAATGVDIMGARAYVPALGVWASPDPALLDEPGRYSRSHPSHSAYTYANTNPVALRDESGEVAIPVIFAGVAAFVGITFAAKKLDEPHARHELVADMARLTGKAIAALTLVSAGTAALAAGPFAAATFVGAAVVGQATGIVTSAVQEKVVEAAAELSPTLGRAAEIGFEVANLVPRVGVRKVAAGSSQRSPVVTPSAARRQAMRQAGIPTSQQPRGQRSPRVPGSTQPGGRQYTYELPAPGGGKRTMSVQHSLTDRVEGHGPHWEAGPIKTPTRLDPLGRPRLESSKVKVEE